MSQLPLNYRDGLRSGLKVALWWVIGVALFVVPLIIFFFVTMMMNHMM